MIRLFFLVAALGLALPLQATMLPPRHVPAHRVPVRAAPVPQLSAAHWDSVATPGPQNSIVIGNPRARVRVTEYLSYTCPHCARFSADSDAGLRLGLIRSGQVSYEIHNLYRDPLDLAGVLVARCRPQRMAAIGAALFAQQDALVARFNDVFPAVSARNAGTAPNVLLKDMAVSTGIVRIAIANGVTAARLDACFATRADIDRIDAQKRATPAEVNGTPTFAINGRIVNVNTWAGIQPLLAAAGAH